MIDDFDKLRALGAQKIHEATHISRLHVQNVLHGDFDGLTKIQLLGFISIFEREYHIDLDDMKQRAIEHFDDPNQSTDISAHETKVFQSSKKERKFSLLYISIAIGIFLAFMFADTGSNEQESTEIIVIDNSAIQSAKSNIFIIHEDINETHIVEEQEEEKIDKIDEIVSFKIYPKIKVWVGYVDLSTHKKHQATFKKELVLDPMKDWLLAFGHGHLDIEINGVIKKYVVKTNIRFSYIDGELKEVNLAEFKRLNKGARW